MQYLGGYVLHNLRKKKHAQTDSLEIEQANWHY